MAGSSRHDPLRNFRFSVEIDGISVAGFSDVNLDATTTEAIEYREGHDPRIRKLPGQTKFGNVTLKRGVVDSLDLYIWHQQIVQGQTVRRNVSIVVLDDDGSDRARFVVRDAWPVRYQVGELLASGNDVLVEVLELANEGVERVAYGTLQLEAVQMATFGRPLAGASDALQGFELVVLKIEDQTVVAISGTAHHTMARFTGRASDVILGTVFAVTPDEIQSTDKYEVAAVRRVAVILQSGLRAWAYVDARYTPS